jgi:hypothetical protein
MQTHPPSIGNNVKLNPLSYASDSTAYKNGFLNLKSVEPSLGLPSGYTLTQTNSVYYFPVFGISESYLDSRKFTGKDNLVFVNKNLGYNTIYPTYNVDISGSFHALSAYIENLSAKYIVPPSGSNSLNFTFDNVYFNTNVYFNEDTFIENLTANSLFTNFLSANQKILTTVYNIFSLTGAYVTNDVIIEGSLTSTNVFASSAIITPFLSAGSALFVSLTSNFGTFNKNLSVGGDLFANKIYGQIDIDPYSQLYYNDKNQLSNNPNRNYIFAVRPSDPYSTDSITTPRTTDGDWFDDYGNTQEDPNVLRPYFKNLQPIFDYVYQNGIYGNNITVYIDEDIVSGELKRNGVYPYATTPYDDSGKYGGCTIKGNLSAGFYSTEWLGTNYPNLTAAGVLGGDFLWGYDNNADIRGVYSYIDLQPIQFNSVDVHARYDIGPLTRTDGTHYYSISGRRFIDSPRKISFRTYVCSNPRLSYGTFTDKVSTWNSVTTKTPVQGRPVSFKFEGKLSLNNLCFEFNTNSNDSTGLIFYNGDNRLNNVTVSLLGNGVYTYGALNLNGVNTYLQIAGTHLGDPTVFTPQRWNNWTYNGYNYESPNIYPGYGIAIVGNQLNSSPTIVNFGTSTAYTGFMNVNNGAFLDITDYNTARNIGRNTQLQSSVILDGKFNANAYFQIGDNARIQGCEYLFSTNNLNISSKNLTPNNFGPNSTFLLQIYDDPKYKVNFKYINYNGTFSTLAINYDGYVNWTFRPNQSISTYNKNSYLNIYNGYKDDFYYNFITTSEPKYIDLTNSLLSIGYLNKLYKSNYNTDSKMYYVNISDLIKYQDYYTLTSPFDTVPQVYTLNYYASSVR